MNVLRDLYMRGLFSTLDEVLEHTDAASDAYDGDLALQRLNAWCDATTAGDHSLFRQLLLARGLEYGDVLKRLGAQKSVSGPSPSWLDVLEEVVATSITELQTLSPGLIRDHARPFGYVIEVLARSAESRRDVTLSQTALAHFQSEARNQMREYLCDRIEAFLAAPLYQSYKSWLRTFNAARDGAHQGFSTETGQDDSHHAFLQDLLTGGLDKLWTALPALARVLGNVIEQWINSTHELIERFDSDREDLLGFVAGSNLDLVVEAVRCGMSDLHNAGRSICVLSLRGGASLVYKPRSVATEHAWERFVEWVGERMPSTTLKPMRVFVREGYGWCEFIQGPVNVDNTRAQAFFYRAGIFLGLLHLLVATDMHEENLVACGDHPVLVDLEMLLQPDLRKRTPDGAEPLRAIFRARNLITDSFLETGLLPMIVKTPETATIGQGGLSHHALFGPRRLGWIEANRLEMTPRLEPSSLIPLANLPQIDGVSVRLHDYWDDFRRGAEDALRFAIIFKSDLLRPGSPLELFKGIPIRITLRPTRYYEMLLRRLLDFRRMSDTQVWSCQADFSSRFEFSPDQPNWPVEFAKREREDLAALNVPHFEVASDAGFYPCSSADVAEEQCYVSGYERARTRIAALDEARIRDQLSILELSKLAFDIEPLDRPARQTGPLGIQVAAAPDVARSDADESLFREEIQSIVRMLKRSAIREGGGCTWLGLTPVGDTDAIALRPLGHALYDGTTGVALFLAAASVALKDQDCKVLCLEALAATRWYLKAESAAGFARTLGLGGTGGIGSVIYAFTSIARILSVPELLEDALGASRLITERMIAGDRTFDISKGSAGTLLALLRLHAETGVKSVLACAIDCAEHLMRYRPEHERALWKRNREPAALAGMSHGASGYALAFHRLHRATGETRYMQVVKDCLEYERSVYSHENQNWPDLRPMDLKTSIEYPVRWCHGAVGIAFARRELIDAGCMDPALDLEYRVARETSRSFGGHRNDSLCCGNFGLIALLMHPCKDQVEETSGSYSNRLLADLIRQARERGSYQWQGGLDNHNPGFFRGVSGIGYIIAKKLVGDSLPNILTLS
jgi:type 2 lantibiotic biosynthesis protein LanM